VIALIEIVFDIWIVFHSDCVESVRIWRETWGFGGTLRVLENHYDRMLWGEVEVFWGILEHFEALWGTLRAKLLSFTCYLLLIGRCTEYCSTLYWRDRISQGYRGASNVTAFERDLLFDSCGNRIILYQSLAEKSTSVLKWVLFAGMPTESIDRSSASKFETSYIYRPVISFIHCTLTFLWCSFRVKRIAHFF
jgi:hypothetical protein